MIDLIFAGTTTSANLVYSVINLLTEQKVVLEKLVSSICEVVPPGHMVKMSDRERLPYLREFVLEVLRYYSIIPLSHRQTVQNTEVCIYS